MTFLQTLVVALVQGITEFLPISSSGHLILVPILTDWPDQGLLIDIAVHMGTLGAVIGYFWRDVWGLIRGGLGTIGIARGSSTAQQRQLALAIVLATIPVVIAGGLLSALDLTDALRTAELIGWTSIIFGIALYLADTKCPTARDLDQLSFAHAAIVGVAQCFALLPGASRAGVTMTAGRLLGYSRTEAARFSMLLSIPTILAAGILITKDIIDAGDAQLTSDALLAGGLALVSALVAIAFFMRWLTHASMTIFVVYRVLLGVGLLAFVYLS